MSKKRIIAIVTTIVLLFAAGISVGVFLYTRGTTQAADGSQEQATNNQNSVTNPDNGDESQTTPDIETGNETENNETDNGDETENNETDNVENVDNENTNAEIGNNQAANNQVTNNNITNNNEATTNTDEVGETTITRIEEQERLVSEDFLDWWQPMKVSVTKSRVGVNIPQITVKKSAITNNEKGNDFVYAGENIIYVIEVTNNGNKTIKNIEITDKVPQNTTFVSMEDITLSNGENVKGTTVTTRNNTVGVKWVVTIPEGETVTARFTVNVNKTRLDKYGNEVPVTGIIYNTAVANGKESNDGEPTKTSIIEKVQIQVPGEDGTEQHDEIILMVDGSYSGDDEWQDMKNTIIEIGKTVLNGTGNTQLTLMAFGMGDNEVLVHAKSVDEIEKTLGELPGSLLYGRSSTNCEAGFTGVSEYIDAHDETLNDVHVIYISDGERNTDETPYAFYNWKQNSWLKRKPEIIAAMSLEVECEYILAGEVEASEAFKTVFGNATEQNVNEIMSRCIDVCYSGKEDSEIKELAMSWCDLVWDAVYDSANFDKTKEYPVSDAERIFVTYDKQNNTHVMEAFYYALWGRSYSNLDSRTLAAGNALAAREEVKTLYIVDSNGNIDKRSLWMNKVENGIFVEAQSISGLIDALEEVLTDLAKTPYNDVVATVYTSKWNNFDESSISIIDNATNTVIYTVAQGWLIGENERPTAEENPIKIEIVSSSEYSNGGEAVEGNTNGDIYKITWKVKDGALLRSDSYRLEYNVTADELENGFENDNNYLTRGNAVIEFRDENGKNQKEELAI